MKSPIFIVGPHRSGSTLWHNVVSMCPGVMRLTDPRFLSERRHKDFNYFLRTCVGDLTTDENVDKMVDLCFARKNLPGMDSTFWRFENIGAVTKPELKKEIAFKIKQSDRRLGAIARILIEEITRFSGYERPCVKFPVDVVHIPKLVEWFPDCKIMHITRDPRAMAMSKTNDPFGTALRILEHPRLAWLIKRFMVWFVIVNYRCTSRLHVRFSNIPNYRLFRFEDLLAEPEKTLKEVCKFIEVEFTEDMLHPERGRHEHQRSSLTGKQQKAFDASAAILWQTIIPRFDKWAITVLTRTSMKRFDYDSETHPIFRGGREPQPDLRQDEFLER
ncbi:MAG: sulfotransferase [Pedosphaera sp.]|nr:sulfotransferase [Pedosphaera sp.]